MPTSAPASLKRAKGSSSKSPRKRISGADAPRVGKPRLDPAQLARRVNVTLDAATIERATRLGDGNLSAGIRRAVASA